MWVGLQSTVAGIEEIFLCERARKSNLVFREITWMSIEGPI